MRILTTATIILLAGCMTQSGLTPNQEADRWALAQARDSGEAQSCIPLSRIRSTDVRNERTIDFVMSDGSVMRSRLPYDCHGLVFNERFAYRTSLDRLCSTDIITVIHSDGGRGATCGLGSFQPVEIPPRR